MINFEDHIRLAFRPQMGISKEFVWRILNQDYIFLYPSEKLSPHSH
jgi:hypothetical protein